MPDQIIKYKDNQTFANYPNDDDIDAKIETLGLIRFRYTLDGVEHQVNTIKDIVKQNHGPENDPDYEKFIQEHYYQKPIYHLMSGLEFLDAVDQLGFMDSDGTLSEIYVNGYISNLGLSHRGLSQGNFLMDHDAFKEICDKFDVLVNWANK